MLTLFGRDDGSIGGEGEVDSGERDQVGLELVQVDIERTVKPERCRDGRNDLGNETVEVGERRRSNAKVSSTNVVDTAVSAGLIVITYASLSTMNEQSECSRVVCVVKTELYGSTTDVDILGAG
jgi:hypothetical protein